MKKKTKQADPTERRLIEEELVNIGTCFDATKLSEIISFLQEQQDELTKEGYSNLQLKFDWCGWDAPYEMCIYGEKFETDSVYYERLARYQEKLEKEILQKQKQEEEKRKKAEEEKESELALLAKLKEKYER